MAPGPSRLPARIDAVLLDAGGVLIDPDFAYIRRLIKARHGEVSIEALSAAEAAARRRINALIGGDKRPGEFWSDYFGLILNTVGLPTDEHDGVIDSLKQVHERHGLWTMPVAGSPEALTRLREEGYRLGVVSNAEGRVARDLERAGYDGVFETVVDSRLVGVEKPDPRIFEIALERMSLRPESTVYVGDVPRIDLDGAQSAGITAILFDRHDLYGDVEALRVRSLGELTGLFGTGSD